MAIIRPGPLIGGISGSIGGTTFVTGKNGLVARIRPQRPKTTSKAQSLARARAYSQGQNWTSLTDDQKNAWNTAGLNNPRTNALGEKSPRSGFEFYLHSVLTDRRDGSAQRILPLPFGTSPPPLNVSVDFSLTTGFDIDADPPAGVVSADFLIFGWPFATVFESRAVPRFVFLESAKIVAFPLDLQASWTLLFGEMQLNQQFAVSISVNSLGFGQSTRIVLRGAMTA